MRGLFFNFDNEYCCHPKTLGNGNENILQYANADFYMSLDWYQSRLNIGGYDSSSEYCYKHRYFIKKIKLTNKMKEDLLAVESNKIQCRLVEIDSELEKLR